MVLLLIWFAVLFGLEYGHAEKLNILYMIADDMNVKYDMPHLSTIVSGKDSSSRKFEFAHSTYPICGPSRTSFLTGMYADQTKSYRFSDKRPDLETIPFYLSMNNYSTASFGKVFHQPYDWYGTDTYRNHFNVRSWNGRSAQAYFEGANWECKGRAYCALRKGEKTSDERVTKAVIRFIEEYQNKTWAAFVGFYRPHLELGVPIESIDVNSLPELENDTLITPMENLNFYECKDLKRQQAYFERGPGKKGEWQDITGEKGRPSSTVLNKVAPDVVRRIMAFYRDAVNHVDKQIGLILRTLKRLNLYQKTAIVFHSDHGWQSGQHGLWCKNSLYDLSTRVPLYLRVPGQTIGALSTDTVSLIDMFPTIRHIVEGSAVKQKASLPGISLLSVQPPGRVVYSQYPRCNQYGSIQTHNCMDNVFDTCMSVPSIKYMGYSAHTSNRGNIYNAILWQPFHQGSNTTCSDYQDTYRTPIDSFTLWNETYLDPMFTVNDVPGDVNSSYYESSIQSIQKQFMNWAS